MVGGIIRKFYGLIKNDLKNIYRDNYLPYFILIPLILSLSFRWLIPYITEMLKHYDFDLKPYYPLIISYFFVLMVPAIIGFANGFVWIDERDNHTLYALQVTPLPLIRYLTCKILFGMLLSIILILIVVPLTGLIYVPILNLFISAVLGSFTAPLFALVLFVFAKNKVEAFAIGKYMYVLYMLPIAAFFIHSAWEKAFVIVPTYWVLKLFWLGSENSSGVWSFFALGFVYQLVILIGATIWFKKVVYKNE